MEEEILPRGGTSQGIIGKKKAFSLLLERGARFLNLERHWDSPVLRNQDGHQGGMGDV